MFEHNVKHRSSLMATNFMEMEKPVAVVPCTISRETTNTPVIIEKKTKKLNLVTKFLLVATGINFALIMVIALTLTAFQTKTATKAEFDEVAREIAQGSERKVIQDHQVLLGTRVLLDTPAQLVLQVLQVPVVQLEQQDNMVCLELLDSRVPLGLQEVQVNNYCEAKANEKMSHNRI